MNGMRFWARVARGGDAECWPFVGATNQWGYGWVMFGGKNWIASRLAWTLTHGPVGATERVRHKCGNPRCCNPAHMFVGPPPQRLTMDTFLASVKKTPTCWLWSGSKNQDGYGRVCGSGRKYSAHRWMYERAVGPIPAELEIDHVCRVRACVNPAHLRLLSHSENCRRGRLGWRKAMCLRGHAFDRVDSKGRRLCSKCLLIRDRSRRAKAKVAA